MDYHHTSWWSPTQSGRGKAIPKNFFISWPGLSLDLVHKHLSKKQSTILRHLQQPRNGLRSPQEKVIHSDPDPEQDQFPPSTQSEETNLVFFKTVDISGNIYTDQIGRFPVTSSQGNKYILVAYHYDSSTIHAEPINTRSWLDLKTAYQKLHSRLTNRGLKPHLYILENDCPNVLKHFMREINENFQLVLHHIYWRNSADRAIQTFKEHVISGISSTHKYFLVHLCCPILLHVIHTLKLLWQSLMNLKIAGYAYLNGELDYNATPLSPPGTQVIIHENPTVRGRWTSHGVKVWYLGPSMNHYWFHHVYVTKTRGEWVSDCVEFFPHNTPLPYNSSSEKCHYRGAWISLCLEKPSTSSTIFQHRRLLDGRNRATFQDIFQRGRYCEE